MSDVWKVEESDGIVIAAHDNPPMNYFVGASDRRASPRCCRAGASPTCGW